MEEEQGSSRNVCRGCWTILCLWHVLDDGVDGSMKSYVDKVGFEARPGARPVAFSRRREQGTDQLIECSWSEVGCCRDAQEPTLRNDKNSRTVEGGV
ncbi:hypothetical protein BC567DRAFT_217701 [Phyllosticta citribraziliensis]